MAETLDAGHAKVWLDGREARGRLDAPAHRRRPQAAVAADQAPRRGRRRPAQPGEHPARVGQERADDRGGRERAGGRGGGRVSDPFAALSDDERALLEPAPAPKTADAMKAVLTDERFSDPDWIFERKLDGIRCIAIRVRRSACGCSRATTCRSTRATPRSSRRSRPRRATRFAIDGEVVAFDGAQTSFAQLAQRGHRDRRRSSSTCSTSLWLDGQDVRELPLRDAQAAAARRARPSTTRVRLTPYRNETGEALFAEACRKGWEGVIAKRADSPYRATRSQGLAEVQVRARARSS